MPGHDRALGDALSRYGIGTTVEDKGERTNEQSGCTLLPAGAVALADLRFHRAAADGLRRGDVVQPWSRPARTSLAAGFAVLIYMLFGWFGTVIRESEGGKFNQQVDASFRWGMGWFIFSEVMFFAAFFGALFYMRVLSVPWLGSGETQEQLWPGFKAAWPVAGPGLEEHFSPMAAWGIPAINTLILLSSGATVTWAHWGLKKNNRRQLILGLFLTIALGMTVPVPAGVRVSPRLHRDEPEARPPGPTARRSSC